MKPVNNRQLVKIVVIKIEITRNPDCSYELIITTATGCTPLCRPALKGVAVTKLLRPLTP